MAEEATLFFTSPSDVFVVFWVISFPFADCVSAVTLKCSIWALWADSMSGCGRLTTWVITIMLMEIPFLPSFSFRVGTYPYGHKRAPLATQLAASHWRFPTMKAFTGPFMLIRLVQMYSSSTCPIIHRVTELQYVVQSWISAGRQGAAEQVQTWPYREKTLRNLRCVRQTVVKFTPGEQFRAVDPSNLSTEWPIENN